MFAVLITEKGGAQRRLEFDKNEVTIGRVQGNDIILPKGNVSKRHSRIVLKDNRFIVVDLKSTNGTYVNGRKITSPLVVKAGDKIYIGDFILTLDEGAPALAAEVVSGPGVPPPPPGADGPPLIEGGGANVPGPGAAPNAAAAPVPPPNPVGVPEPPAPPPPAPQNGSAGQERFALEEEPAGGGRSGPSPRVISSPPDVASPPVRPPGAAQTPHLGHPVTAPPSPGTGNRDALAMVVAYVARTLDRLEGAPPAPAGHPRRQEAERQVQTALRDLEPPMDGTDEATLAAAAVEELVGLGALASLVDDGGALEILVEGPGRMLVDRGEGHALQAGVFSTPEALAIIVGRLVAMAGGRFDPGRPLHEGTLPNGLHFSAVLPPVAVGGPQLELRRTARPGITGEQLVGQGTLSPPMLEVLNRAVQAERNVVVVGAHPAVGQVVSALVNAVDDGARSVTVEESPTLELSGQQAVRLCAAPGADLAQLIQQAVRMRGDRLVIDGVRGPETLGALLALASRSGGGLMGIRSASGPDALSHVSALAQLGGGSRVALERILPSAIQVLVRVGASGAEGRVESVAEVLGDGGTVRLNELFAPEFKSVGQPEGF
ncbi:MAG: ATPase, T2SS/T4P/T4SS family [Sandaracinaceae bacterium]